MKTYYLGRDFTDPIKISDKSVSVSHKHATITIDGDEWILQDTESTNGTYIEENGIFRRYSRCKISPSTWIRLGEQGHRGYYFKARRVLKPNNYQEDFAELYDIYHELEEAKKNLDSKRRLAKFMTPVLMVIGLIVSFLPEIKDSAIAVRASFMLPGFVSPFLQDLLLNHLGQKVRNLQSKLICPKCRRQLSKDDIINREHPYCKAH